MKPRIVLPLLFLLLLSISARADGPLRSIVIFGNEKTERNTILNIIGLDPDTYVNNKAVRMVDERLVTSGLFKSVQVRKSDNRDGTTDLRVVVVEKQLWFVFPMFQAWSGRYSGGLVFGESNLFLPNGKTLFILQGGNEASRAVAAWDVGKISGSNFAFRTWTKAGTDDVPLYTGSKKTSEITLRDAAIGVIPGYDWTNEIRTSFAFKYRFINYGEAVGIEESGTEGDDISMELMFEYDSLARREAFLKGTRLRASHEFADTRVGTDYAYYIERVEFLEALQVLQHFNYVLNLEGAIGTTLPFHRDFTLGGTSLRGYSDRQFRGDTLITAKQEILFRLYHMKWASLFGLAFYDVGLLYPEQEGIGRSRLHNGTGGGLRMSLADILAPVFGLDFAYGIEDQSFQVYFALGLVEF